MKGRSFNLARVAALPPEQRERWFLVGRFNGERLPDDRPPLQEPTLAQMASNFAEALGGWAKAGFPLASAEVTKERAETCSICPRWDPAARGGLGKCNSPACGCTKLKVFLATSRCPEGKWLR